MVVDEAPGYFEGVGTVGGVPATDPVVILIVALADVCIGIAWCWQSISHVPKVSGSRRYLQLLQSVGHDVLSQD